MKVSFPQIPQSFDANKYSNLQEAFKLLGKSILAMDQLHMNFISAIHTTAFTVLLEFSERLAADKQKQLFEELCDKVPAEKLIPCLLRLCKSFWCVLVCYYQVALWHQSAAKPVKPSEESSADDPSAYVQQKFKSGYCRIWNEVQAKMAAFLTNSTKLHTLKYEQFIQVLSIVQRLRKVGVEFCSEPSIVLMDAMRHQSTQFFERYHLSCLDEICLFIDNEAWMPVHSFSSLVQLQEFNAVKSSLQRYLRRSKRADDGVHSAPARMSPTKRSLAERKKSFEHSQSQTLDETMSIHSQEDCGSSVYGSCGYFLRFSEKSSPFDGGFDEAMLEEDILAGIADESSCYFSEESEGEQQNGDDSAIVSQLAVCKASVMVNNSSLNVLRCIGRYLQMCKLLHSIAPQIVKSMTELIEFYVFAVHELFAKDSPISTENVYTALLTGNLSRIAGEIATKVKSWPPSTAIVSKTIPSDVILLHFVVIRFQVEGELSNPDALHGLMARVVGVEGAITIVQQFAQIRGYLEYLISSNDQNPLERFLDESQLYLPELRKPVYMCVTARVVDLPSVLTSMSKVKWDINHVNVEHSIYVSYINRGLQTFSMRLEEIEKILAVPRQSIWDSVAHVITHTLVEG